MEDRKAQDQALVRSVLDGETNAFSDLVARYQKLVAGVAWRYGVGREEVEDVVSEIFLKTYRNLHQYRPEHAFSTWLYRLAANHVVDRGRRARKERGRSEMPEQVEDTRPGQAEGLELGERARLLRDALQELPAHYRDAIFLVYVEGLKLDEAAHTLGLPLGTIKTRLMRGRQGLRKILVRRHPEYFGED